MKKLFVPLLLDGSNAVERNGVTTFIAGVEPFKGYGTFEDAEAAAKDLALKCPTGKVMVLEGMCIIEPRSIQFATKKWNDSGELIA